MGTKKHVIWLIYLLTGILLFVPYGYAGTIDLSPPDGDYMAVVGTEDFGMSPEAPPLMGNNVYDNWIMQTVTGDFSMKYNFFTWDYDPFDAPGFAIFVGAYSAESNYTPLYSINAGDIDTDPEGWTGLDYTDWTTYSSSFGDSVTRDIYFYAGNTGDEFNPSDVVFQSWVYLDLGAPFLNGSFETGDFTSWSHSGNTAVLSGFSEVYSDPFPEPVPIPGAVWLLGSGLIGLAGFRRKKFKK